MSLKTFRVEFDRNGATYSAGDIVSGNIVIETCKPKKTRALYLTAIGNAYVHWTETESRRNSKGKYESYTESYSNSEKYFNFEFNLLGAKGSGREIEIPIGHHRYPFSFQLPKNIPSSFENITGYVRYTVKGVIDRPWRFNHECKAAFTVLSDLDLNAHQQKCLGIDDEDSTDFCCCCFSQGSLSVNIRVPSSGYVPGQTIYKQVGFINSSESVEMTSIETRLEQKLSFHAISKTKTDTCPMVCASEKGPFMPKGEIVSELLIPPLPPSGLEFCKIIDLQYVLKVIVHVSGMHRALNKEYPILIGTVPLYTQPSAPSLSNLGKVSGLQQTMEEPPMVHVPMPMPMPMPMPVHTYGFSSQDQLPNSHDFVNPIHAIGFVNPSLLNASAVNWQIAPPSYEECMSGTQHIREHDESNYVYGANNPFAPRYPVFNYPSPTIADKY